MHRFDRQSSGFSFLYLSCFFFSQLRLEMPGRRQMVGEVLSFLFWFCSACVSCTGVSLFGVLLMVNNQRGAAACGIWRSALWCLGSEGLTLGLLGKRGWGEGPCMVPLNLFVPNNCGSENEHCCCQPAAISNSEVRNYSSDKVTISCCL